MAAPRDPLILFWNRLLQAATREALDILGFQSPPIGPRPRSGARKLLLGALNDSPTLRPYATLGVLPSAPREVVEAAYRTLAKAAHPDTGGSAERMRVLNAAIASIRKERRWKG